MALLAGLKMKAMYVGIYAAAKKNRILVKEMLWLMKEKMNGRGFFERRGALRFFK